MIAESGLRTEPYAHEAGSVPAKPLGAHGWITHEPMPAESGWNRTCGDEPRPGAASLPLNGPALFIKFLWVMVRFEKKPGGGKAGR